MIDKNGFEEKLKKEIESYKRQVNFYKEKMKIEIISNTTRKLEKEMQMNVNANLENYRANALSPKKSKKALRINNTSKIKKKIHDDVSRQVNFDDMKVNEFNEKFENNYNNNDNNEISFNGKEDIQNKDNLGNENVILKNNFQSNKSLKLINSKVNNEKELHNSLNYESMRDLNNLLNKEKTKEIKFNNNCHHFSKRHNEAAKIREANIKKKLDENVVFQKNENEKIIQNNCQNIYNVSINPIGILFLYFLSLIFFYF